MMLLQVKNAKFSYDGKKNVFENISFSVKEGEIFCILGPNGSGKSTLLKCIDNLLRLNSGSVSLDEKELISMGRKELATYIGFLPQLHVSTFPFNVTEVAVMGRAPHLSVASSPSVEDYALAEANLKMLGIGHLADKPYTNISGGERQLTLIAMVLTQQPRFLLLDEPTSHLDFGNQLRMLNLIQTLSQKGFSIILTTHFPDHAFHLSSTVAMMNEGTFVAQGNADEIITEKNLKKIYGIDVQVVHVNSSKVCLPVKT